MKAVVILRRAFALALALVLGLFSVWAFLQVMPARAAALPAPAALPQLPSAGPLRLLHSSPEALEVQVDVPQPSFHVSQTADGQPCQELRLDGFTAIDPAGRPALPARGALLGIPPDGEPQLELLQADFVELPGTYRLCPVLTPAYHVDPQTGAPQFDGYRSLADPAVYQTDVFTPTRPALLAGTAWVRSQRAALLRFQPLQYNPLSGRLRVASTIRVALRLPAGPAAARPAAGAPGAAAAGPAALAPVDEGPFETLLQAGLLHYDQARAWRSPAAAPGGPAAARPATAPPVGPRCPAAPGASYDCYRVRLNQDGLHRLTYADLLAAGIPDAALDGLDPRSLRLELQGAQVALLVSGEQDGVFDSTDALFFLGQKLDQRFSDTSVYWLSWGGGSGLRMASASAAPQPGLPAPGWFTGSLLIEQRSVYFASTADAPRYDHFYWTPIINRSLTNPAAWTTSFALVDLAAGPGARFAAHLRGYSTPTSHTTQVLLNSQLLTTAVYAANAPFDYSTAIPAALLKPTGNQVRLNILPSGGTDVNLARYFEVFYPRKFNAAAGELAFDLQPGSWTLSVTGFSTSTLLLLDVTDPQRPRVFSETLALSNQGQYALQFSQALSARRQYRAVSPAAWLKPKAIELDTPSDLLGPHSAADYLLITHASFITEMRRLVEYRAGQGFHTGLVDVQDIYDEFNGGVMSPDAIRSFLTQAYQSWRSPALSYVVLAGDGSVDPRAYTGYAELQSVPPYLDNVDLFLGEAATDNRYAMLSGDDPVPDIFLGRLSVRTPAEAAAVVQKLIHYEQTPPGADGWNRRLMFVADNPDNAGDFHYYSNEVADYYVPDPYTAQKIYYPEQFTPSRPYTTTIIQGINDGRLIVSYVGHGAQRGWAGTEMLMKSEWLGQLTNYDRLVFFTPMTCLEGYFVGITTATFDASALAESYNRLPNGGAVGSFSPSGLGLASGHDYLERGLFDAIFNQYVDRLGPATTLAKLFIFGETSGHRDLIETYMLFGDPATRLHLLRPQLTLTKSAFIPPPEPGRPLDVGYVLRYTNQGDRTAARLVISDVLPAWALSAAFSYSGPQVTARPGAPYTWDVADLAPGAQGVITLTIRPDASYLGVYTNTAAIAALGELETRLDDNQAGAGLRYRHHFLPLVVNTIFRIQFPAVFGPRAAP
ncbi:MAG: C25 family cysteine peptidase [Chloroflexota bacterium]